jgi:hypothetical protein
LTTKLDDPITTEPNDSLPGLRPPTSGFGPESFDFKQENIEQGISNIEVITTSFCGSVFCCSIFSALKDLPSVVCPLSSLLRRLSSNPRLAHRVYPEFVEGPDIPSSPGEIAQAPYFTGVASLASPVKILELAIKQVAPPGQGQNHQHKPGSVSQLGQEVIVFQPTKGSQDVFPIVPVRLLSGYTSQKD